MKLLDKYNRISMITMALVIVVTGIIYYYTISAILTHQKEKDLVVEENEVFDFVKLNHKLPQVFESKDQQIYFTPAGATPVLRRFIATQFYNRKDNKAEAGKGLISAVVVNGKRYQIEIDESVVETEYLIRIIFLITLGVIVLLILMLFIINQFAMKRLWQPFYNLLGQIKRFNLSDKNTIAPPRTDIDEFRELNQSISVMAQRVNTDYQELKSFIASASHELMTPVAVIGSKLDTLMQTGDFTTRQSELMGHIYGMMDKLTRLNKSMLLLTKIESKLIQDDHTFDLKPILEDSLLQYQELFINKAITVEAQLISRQLHMSRTLLDILLNNLLGNAIRHNLHGGHIIIILTESELKISNTGASKALPASQIFQRFHKSAESEGIGLGLTLVQQICINYNFSVAYRYSFPYHSFMIGLS